MMMSEYLLERWYGEPGELQQWAAKMADEIGGELGNEMYFHALARVTCYETHNMFNEMGLDYERAIAGGESILRKYPQNYQSSNNQVVNFLARFAALKGDRERGILFFTDVGNAWTRWAWRDQAHFDTWNEWARMAARISKFGNTLDARR